MQIHQIIVNDYPNDPRFQKLNQLNQAVNKLYYKGNNILNLLDKPKVAIVGSRKYTEYGKTVTEQLVKGLVDAGVVIISGLAIGIDSIAHQSAIDNGGVTIAVLPAGLDNIYPLRHQGLAKKILYNHGALISEYPIKSGPPLKHQFIARNRIIAALADVVLIPEAAEKSGSLHTANFALELGSEVLAVPGNITSPNSTGTNRLIQNGATPVNKIEDIIEVLETLYLNSKYLINTKQGLLL